MYSLQINPLQTRQENREAKWVWVCRDRCYCYFSKENRVGSDKMSSKQTISSMKRLDFIIKGIRFLTQQNEKGFIAKLLYYQAKRLKVGQCLCSETIRHPPGAGLVRLVRQERFRRKLMILKYSVNDMAVNEGPKPSWVVRVQILSGRIKHFTHCSLHVVLIMIVTGSCTGSYREHNSISY